MTMIYVKVYNFYPTLKWILQSFNTFTMLTNYLESVEKLLFKFFNETMQNFLHSCHFRCKTFLDCHKEKCSLCFSKFFPFHFSYFVQHQKNWCFRNSNLIFVLTWQTFNSNLLNMHQNVWRCAKCRYSNIEFTIKTQWLGHQTNILDSGVAESVCESKETTKYQNPIKSWKLVNQNIRRWLTLYQFHWTWCLQLSFR